MVLAVHSTHGIGDFADGGVGFDCLDNSWHQVTGTTRGVFHLLECRLPLCPIALGAHRTQSLDLLVFQGFVDPLQRYRLLLVELQSVYAHNYGFVAINLLLVLISGVLDLLLHETAFDRLQNAAHSLDLVQVFARAGLDLIG